MIDKKTFLVVDDHEPMRKSVMHALKETGYIDVVLATDGIQARKLLQQTPVDAIISDWNMPNMNGLQLLKSLRADEQYKNVPFMLVTGEASREKVLEAIGAKVSEMLLKPFTAHTLVEKSQRMLAYSRLCVDASGQNAPFGKELPAMETSTMQGLLATTPEHPADSMITSLIGGEEEEDNYKPTILVIDDTPANIHVIIDLFTEIYHVKVANSGKRALSILEGQVLPDLILLDVMMPEMDGLEVCRLLKANPRTVEIPVIFLTAKGEAVDVVTGLELGAVDYVTKPAEPTILKARVNTHLHLKLAHDKLKRQNRILAQNAIQREEVERISRHDIKTPLSVVLNEAKVLLDDRNLMQEKRHSIEMIEDSARNMLWIVNHSLDLYKMETGTYQIELHLVNLVPLCIGVVRDIEHAIPDRRVSVHVLSEGQPVTRQQRIAIKGDEMLCHTLLCNLLRNAVEGSLDGDEVTLTLVQHGDRVEIRLHNSGCIPETIRSKFFEKYVTSGKPQGTGLGAYSAMMMTKAQGGTIRFETSEEAGTTLIVELLAPAG